LTFLLAVTSARSISDLTKLSIGDHCRVSSSGLTFLPTSLAKADDPSHFQQEVVIAGFRDKKLCPLRVFKAYLRKTEALRGQGPDRWCLLRYFKEPHRPPSSQTISRWLVATIQMAYENSAQQTSGRV
jgi:hypothetical protein